MMMPSVTSFKNMQNRLEVYLHDETGLANCIGTLKIGYQLEELTSSFYVKVDYFL